MVESQLNKVESLKVFTLTTDYEQYTLNYELKAKC